MNDYIIYDDICYIILCDKNGKEKARAIIDSEDLNRVNKFRWNHDGLYVATGQIGGKKIRLHQFILGKKDGFHIDHINHDELDNRKCNLRHVTISQNHWNNKSKGYAWDKRDKIWIACVRKFGKRVFVKYCKTEEEAKKAVREARLIHHGEYANVKTSPTEDSEGSAE